jgi:magnesium-transporting ATPase (P-type)
VGLLTALPSGAFVLLYVCLRLLTALPCAACAACTQGTHVTSGRCRAVVVGTGTSTAIGKIRDAMVASQVS